MTGHRIEVVVLAENTVRRAGLLGGHGPTFSINAGGRIRLFDTGQGKVLPENAQQLGIHLGEIEAVATSLNDSTRPGTLTTLTYKSWGALATLTNGCAGSRYPHSLLS